jgi:hypothetical protein
MQKRECSDCGGDLVLAVRGNQAPTNQSPSLVTSAITSWRWSTCGSAFSAAQLRLNKRERLKATARA